MIWQHRADVAIAECVLPHVLEDGAHIVVADHGVCIGELISALLRLDPDSRGDVLSHVYGIAKHGLDSSYCVCRGIDTVVYVRN